MVGGNFRSSTCTSAPRGGALIPGTQDCSEQRRNTVQELTSNPQTSEGGCGAKSCLDIILWSQYDICTSDAPRRSSVDDSVSLTTTALVTCMSGCCCLASCIAIARACEKSVWELRATFYKILVCSLSVSAANKSRLFFAHLLLVDIIVSRDYNPLLNPGFWISSFHCLQDKSFFF